MSYKVLKVDGNGIATVCFFSELFYDTVILTVI